MEIDREEYERIAQEISSENSVVGIDAKKTHVIIIHKLIEIEKRLKCLEKEIEEINVNTREVSGVEMEIANDRYDSWERKDLKSNVVSEIKDNYGMENLEDGNEMIEDEVTGDVTTDELKELIESEGDYVLIDVREPWEIESYGKIRTSFNIPKDDILGAFSHSVDSESFKNTYPFDKPKENDLIILYCRSGQRSAEATEKLKNLGYKKARNYRGSVIAWSEIDEEVQSY